MKKKVRMGVGGTGDVEILFEGVEGEAVGVGPVTVRLNTFYGQGRRRL